MKDVVDQLKSIPQPYSILEAGEYAVVIYEGQKLYHSTDKKATENMVKMLNGAWVSGYMAASITKQ